MSNSSCLVASSPVAIRIQILTLGAALVSGLTMGTASGQDLDKQLSERISEAIGQEVTDHHLVGVAVSIVVEGSPVYRETFGFADLDAGRELTANTPFQLASLSKQFAATSVMLLVRDGKLSLDDPIAKHLEVPEAWNAITVRQLLGHTSGIKDYAKFPGIKVDYKKDLARGEILKRIFSHPLDFQPGAKLSYSNSGYVLAGCLVEAVSGTDYATFLKRRVFDPLEMQTARLEPAKNDDPGRALGYEYDGGTFSRATYNSPNWSFAAGGIVASLYDLAKWDAAIDDHSLLTADEQETLWEPQVLNGERVEFGLGWMTRPGPGGKRFVLHFGGKPGFSTAMARLVEDRTTIIVLSNRTEGRATQILDQVGKLFLAAKASGSPSR